MSNFITRTVVGMVVSYLLLTLILAATPQTVVGQDIAGRWGFGPVESVGSLLNNMFTAAIFLLFYLVCTAGMGLVIWIPVSYGLGWIVFKILGWDKVRSTAPALERNRPATPTSKRDTTALLSFIAKARDKGLSDEQIRLDLAENGWSVDQIKGALAIANRPG